MTFISLKYYGFIKISIMENKNKKILLVHDLMHGYITIDPVAKSIIDTPVFQRLKRIYQMGIAHYVFPNATHTRFEHSIGVYHLAKNMITNIKNNQPELNITENVIKVVSIAGLCHDLGHLMYSHLFDDLFLPSCDGYESFSNLKFHEYRSCLLLRYVIDNYDVDISNEEYKVICELIEPENNTYDTWDEEFKVGRFIFQIVSNQKNGVDVDKFDYINRDNRACGNKIDVDFSRLIMQARVINDEICYPIQTSEQIYELFLVRYRSHKKICGHKALKSFELLFTQILKELEKKYHISDYINNPKQMIKLDDYFIYHTDNKNVEAILEKIETRNIPKRVFEITLLHEFDFNYDLLKRYPEESYSVVKFKVGYSNNKNVNPLENISFYETNTKQYIDNLDISNYSLLINTNHIEYVFRIYCNDKNLKEDMKSYFSSSRMSL